MICIKVNKREGDGNNFYEKYYGTVYPGNDS